jgi:AraC family transcriptional regulator, transcriptional activator of pobA
VNPAEVEHGHSGQEGRTGVPSPEPDSDDLSLRQTTDLRSGIARYEIRPQRRPLPEFEIRDLHGYYDRYRDNMTKPHRHAFYQVLWFARSGRHSVDFADHPHGSDAFFFIAKDQVHHFERDVVPEGRLLHFNDDYLGAAVPAREDVVSELFDSLDRRPLIQPRDPDRDELIAIIRLIDQEYGRPAEQRNRTIATCLLGALLLAAQRCKTHAERPAVESRHANTRLFLEFRTLLDREFASSHRAEPFARALGVSVPSLDATCRAVTGRSTKQLIMERVLLEARRELVYSRLPVAEIAARVGFSDALYFSRVFTRRTGLPPTEFRRTLSG